MSDFSLNDLIDPLQNAARELGDDELPDKKRYSTLPAATRFHSRWPVCASP